MKGNEGKVLWAGMGVQPLPKKETKTADVIDGSTLRGTVLDDADEFPFQLNEMEETRQLRCIPILHCWYSRRNAVSPQLPSRHCPSALPPLVPFIYDINRYAGLHRCRKVLRFQVRNKMARGGSILTSELKVHTTKRNNFNANIDKIGGCLEKNCVFGVKVVRSM